MSGIPENSQPQPPAKSEPAPDGISETGTRASRAQAEASEDLAQAVADVEGVIATITTDARNELDSGTALLNTLYDELVGAADLDLQAVTATVMKVLNKIVSDTQKIIATALGDIGAVGIAVPYQMSDFASLLDGDWLQLVATAVPSMAPILGISPAVDTATPIHYAPADSPYSQVTDYPIPISSPPVSISVAPLPTRQPIAFPGQFQPPRIDPFEQLTPRLKDIQLPAELPPPVPPPPPPSDPYAPKDADCCCPDPTVNVTVNVPPITVPPSTIAAPAPPVSPGSSPRPTAPAPRQPAGPIPFQLVPPGRLETEVIPPGREPAPSVLLFPDVTSFGAKSTTDGINWNETSACNLLPDVMSRLTPQVRPSRNQPSKPIWDTFVDSQLSWLGTFQAANSGFAIRAELDAMRDKFNASSDIAYNVAKDWIGRAVGKVGFDMIAPQAVPNAKAASFFGARLALATKGEDETGFPLRYLYQADEYLYQWSNPQYLPNQVRVDSAFLAGQITDGTWTCWTRANGNLPEPARKIMLGDQAKPGIADLVNLRNRGLLTDKAMHERARACGVLDPGFMKEWIELMKQLPTQSDLIRFMVRDAADDNVAKKYGYDEGFTDKYTGPMKAWGKAIGLDDEYFKYQWRSHWRTPSFTQLGEMLARLRPDRPEVKEWNTELENLPVTANPALIGPKPLQITPDEVAKALQVDDMAPGWVYQLMAISTTPINRTDSVRAYMIGAFDENRLYHAFRDVQYSDRDAKTLVEYYKQDKARRNRNVSGVWSIKKIVRYFKEGLLTRQVAFDLLRPLGPNDAAANAILNGADQEIAADILRIKLRGLRRGFMYGEFNAADARKLLVQWGMDDEQCTRVLNVWRIERDSRWRQPTVSMLAKWLKDGIIGLEEARVRLYNLGYNSTDADRIIAGALKWNFGDEPPTPDELSEAISEHVKNQKEAKDKSNNWLVQAAKAAEATLRRIRAEQLRRLPPEQKNQWNPLTIP
jgi:hypothetical protein